CLPTAAQKRAPGRLVAADGRMSGCRQVGSIDLIMPALLRRESHRLPAIILYPARAAWIMRRECLLDYRTAAICSRAGLAAEGRGYGDWRIRRRAGRSGRQWPDVRGTGVLVLRNEPGRAQSLARFRRRGAALLSQSGQPLVVHRLRQDHG